MGCAGAGGRRAGWIVPEFHDGYMEQQQGEGCHIQHWAMAKLQKPAGARCGGWSTCYRLRSVSAGNLQNVFIIQVEDSDQAGQVVGYPNGWRPILPLPRETGWEYFSSFWRAGPRMPLSQPQELFVFVNELRYQNPKPELVPSPPPLLLLRHIFYINFKHQ